MAEDAPGTLLEQLRAESIRRGTCTVCEWIKTQPNAAEWDAVMAVSWQEVNAAVIHRRMKSLGFEQEAKSVQTHRSKGHRVA